MPKLSDYQVPPVSEIFGQVVTVSSVSFETGTANGREYTRTIVNLSNGESYRSAARPVADTFSRLPLDAFPVEDVIFEEVPSKIAGHQPYVQVRDATEDEISASKTRAK